MKIIISYFLIVLIIIIIIIIIIIKRRLISRRNMPGDITSVTGINKQAGRKNIPADYSLNN